MNLKDSHFHYNAVVKNEQNITLESFELFPTLDEIAFQSRSFSSYAEAVKSCKGFMEDVTKDVNSNIEDKRFKVGAEVNPLHTGNKTFSKDWAAQEVARFWVYDKNMEGTGNIAAICRGSIFSIEPAIETRLLN